MGVCDGAGIDGEVTNPRQTCWLMFIAILQLHGKKVNPVTWRHKKKSVRSRSFFLKETHFMDLDGSFFSFGVF